MEFKMRYVPGAKFLHADALSRLRFEGETRVEEKIGIFKIDLCFADQQTIKLIANRIIVFSKSLNGCRALIGDSAQKLNHTS